MAILETVGPMLGSPPRMRGKGAKATAKAQAARITPAYAGKRTRGESMAKRTRDHPRVCGEKKNMLMAMGYNTGSPPRMRGKGSRCRTLQHRHRITPAYAGKSGSTPWSRSPPQDHPRVCGEKQNICLTRFLMAGSPPRMRGKVSRNELWALQYGITPAYAGKRKSICRILNIQEDHPRVCGEKRL